MAEKSYGRTKGYTFEWKIKNLNSFRWLMEEDVIESPQFVADTLKGTKWSLCLRPMRRSWYCSHIKFDLNRKHGGSPQVIVVNSQLTILGKDGSLLVERTVHKHGFEQCGSWGFEILENASAILGQDTLTLRGSIWNEEEPVEPKFISARTVFKKNMRTLEWRNEEFSALRNGMRSKYKDKLLDFDLVLKENYDQENLFINISEFDASVLFFSFKASFIDKEGKKKYCQTLEYFAKDLRKGEFSVPIFTKQLTENRSRYFLKDVLSLDCESVIWAKIETYEYFRSGITPELTNEIAESRHEYNAGKEKSPATSVLVKDLKSMYDDGIFSDMELRTSTRTFKVHKNILSARSPVFRSMFSNDMKEKNSGHVDISDFGGDTIHKMLLYIYTDSLEDLQFETALKLYAISDKYYILSLKRICSSFLKDDLCPTSICEVLDLAILHSDDDLENFVLDYILEQPKEFFLSQLWKVIMNSHSEFAKDVMCKKICPQ